LPQKKAIISHLPSYLAFFWNVIFRRYFLAMNKNKKKTALERPSHGVYSWLRTGKVNPSIRGHRRIQRYLREIKADLIKDLGGPENLTAAKEVLVEATIQAYGVLLLATAYTARYSILDPVQARRGILSAQPILSHQFVAFMNTIRQNLMALGLDKRKGDDALTIQDVIREFDERKAKSAGDSSEGAEKTQPGPRKGNVEAISLGIKDGDDTGEER
jgi:hypothetical protein